MKRIVYALLATLSGVVLLFSYRTSLEAVPAGSAAAAPISGGSGGTASGATTPAPQATASPTTPASPSASRPSAPPAAGTSGGGASSTGLADGSYTGAATNTRYGPVQVRVTVAGGSISDVTVLQYPNSEREDRQINQSALPVLISETLSAQSASIDMVSGATYTSKGYVGSLQSALDQARR